jgi:excisionase family DNA binding protein
MPVAEQLLAEDGSVRVPARLANAVFVALVGHLAAQTGTSGGEVSPDARALLHALHRAASGAPSSTSDTPASAPVTVVTSRVVGVAEAAAVLGCHPSYVRRLCLAGRIPATRITGGWIIEAAALDHHRHGTGDDAHDRPANPPGSDP